MGRPNEWRLSSRGLHVTYLESDIGGQPRLTYHEDNGAKVFSGEQIAVETFGKFGTVVSVELYGLDLGGAQFSLLLPLCELLGHEVLPVSVVGVTTVRREPELEPRHGQFDTFTQHRLSGTATSLQTLARTSADD